MKRSRETEIDWRTHSGQPSLRISDSKGVTIRLQALKYTPYMLQIFENGDIWARNSDLLTIGHQFNHCVVGDIGRTQKVSILYFVQNLWRTFYKRILS